MLKTTAIACLFFTTAASAKTLHDSTGKELRTGIVRDFQPEMNLRQKIVQTAFHEFQQWHNEKIIRENEPAASDKMKKYWAELNWKPTEKQLADSLWQEQHPWSAAFISWIIKQAGAGNQFKYSTRHSEYIVWARNNANQKKQQSLFTAYSICDPRSAWPQPGDMLCKNRDGKNLSLKTISAYDISHGDIVVEVNKEKRTITTMGGNLLNTVSKRILYLDAEGFIDLGATWRIEDEDAGNPTGLQSEFFSVIKLSDTDSGLRPSLR
ncbi:MAG: hypothetical protein C4308_09545 [Chitinophagaceae bacterium]